MTAVGSPSIDVGYIGELLHVRVMLFFVPVLNSGLLFVLLLEQGSGAFSSWAAKRPGRKSTGPAIVWPSASVRAIGDRSIFRFA